MTTASTTPPHSPPTDTVSAFTGPGVSCTILEIEPILLTVDHTVQRPLDSIRVAQIASDFDRDSIGVIHVSQRTDGTHHVVDGQHRIAALHLLDLAADPVKCVLWTGLTQAGEAALFRRLNNTRQIQILDRFRIRIVEGEPIACALNSILNEHGWTVQKFKTQGSFFAVAALEKVFKARGDDGDLPTCNALIECATQAWGHDSNALRAEIVGGLGVLLRVHPHLDKAKLITELSKHEGGPLALIGRAKQLRDIRGGKISDSMAEILVNLHNKRRVLNRLPEWGAE